jgi:3-oxoacyl-[acyl-carrier protein] reductase
MPFTRNDREVDPVAYPNRMRVAMVGGERSLADGLAERLRERGTPTVTIGNSEQLSCDLASAEAIERHLFDIASQSDEPLAIVRLAITSAQTTAGELAEIELDTWVERTEAPLREAIAFHQAAQRFLATRGGRIVVLVPTVGLAGGPGFVPLAATAEADRTLVKAQARVGGALGITLNTIAVTSSLLAGSGVDIDRGGLPALALAAPGLAQVADVIVGLLGPAFAAVTGQTIAVDGGCWMAL